MSDLVKYLEGVKAKLGLKNDRQLAIKMGITSPAMSHIMSGMSVPSDETCLRLAALAGDDPEQVLLLAHKTRAPEVSRSHWERIFKKIVSTTVVLFMVAVLTFFALPSPACAAPELSQDILCQILLVFSGSLGVLYLAFRGVRMDRNKNRPFFGFSSLKFLAPALALVLVLAFPSPAPAEDPHGWTTTDTALEAAFSAVLLVDCLQTRAAMRDGRYVELNPFLGKAPDSGKINAYCLTVLTVHYLIARALPRPWRTVWQSFWIGFEAETAWRHARIGIHVTF